MKIVINNSISQLVIGGHDHIVDSKLAKNIRDYLSVDVPGAFHSDLYKRHVWDGRRYFITPKLKMATGMLPLLLDYLEDVYQDLEVELIDERKGMVTFPEKWDAAVSDYAMDGDYAHQLRLAQAYNHYISYRNEKIYFPRGIVDAATNAGKTTIIAGIFHNAICDNKKMLILIHRKAIYNQLVAFMGEVFGEVGQINSKFYEIKDVTVAMAPTLANRLAEGVVARNDLAKFPIIVVDECHRSGSKTYKNILKHCDAFCRVFLSGTALDSDDDIAKLDSIANSGPKLAEVSKVELMDKGVSTPVAVKIHLCNTLCYKDPKDYRECQDECVEYSSERLAIIHGIVKKASGPTLVAVQHIEHGQYIYDNIQFNGHTSGKRVELTHGDDPAQLKKIDQFKNGEIDVLISTAILSEGVNIPNIREIIYAVGGKAKVSIKQWMGRGERLAEGKDQVIFHDLYDIGPYVQKHSEARLKVYHDEGLPVTMDFDIKFARKLKLAVI